MTGYILAAALWLLAGAHIARSAWLDDYVAGQADLDQWWPYAVMGQLWPFWVTWSVVAWQWDNLTAHYRNLTGGGR